MEQFQQRRDRLRRLLRRAELDALLVTSPPNVTYLTGFSGDDSYLLIDRKGETILSDGRYATQIEEECPGLAAIIRLPGTSMSQIVGRGVKERKLRRIGVEATSISLKTHGDIAAQTAGVEMVATTGLVEQLRMIKDRGEIELIRRAIWQAEKAFGVVRAGLRGEQSEKEIAFELERQMRYLGASGCSFPPIVAAGERAALPHGRPTDRKIGDGGFVLIDWGADFAGYKSDLTRVLVTGKIPPKLERVYGVVLRAQEQAMAAVRPGATVQAVDEAARRVIADAGLGRFFSHGLGHGIGLEIHESPRMAKGEERKLEPGMVVTVEPGVYLPKRIGVRIEDDVLVTKGGCEVLTHLPKSWEDALSTP